MASVAPSLTDAAAHAATTHAETSTPADVPAPAPTPAPRVGYVLKMYPRFSETFIVHEILQQEAAGTEVEIFSLRLPIDGRFHEALAEVRAPVTYLNREHKVGLFWQELARATAEVPGVADHLDSLLAAAPDEALAAVQLAEQVHRRGLQHLHAHFGSIAAEVARLASLLTGVGFSFTAHAKDIFHAEVDPAALRARLAQATSVVTVSDYNLAHLRSEFGTAAANVTRLYNSVDLDAFPFTPAPTEKRRDHTARIAAVGRLVEKKGFADLIAAVSILRDRGVDLHLDLVGSGPEEPRLRALIADAGLADTITLLGGLPQSQVRRIVAGADVFAAPCVVGADGNRDGLPTVLLEAMALGTPVVSTPVTGIPEVVRHGETGLLVPEGDPRALADALLATLHDPESAAPRARAGRALLEQHFDFRQHARELQTIFRTAIAAGEGTRHASDLQAVGA